MPLLDLIWTMLIWFLLFAWLVVIGFVIVDIFRSDDLNGLAKAGWILFVVFFIWLGVAVYLIARGESMSHRYAAAAASRGPDGRVYSRTTAGRTNTDPLAGLNPTGRAGLTGGMDYDTQRARMTR